jgi:hypothetical protein
MSLVIPASGNLPDLYKITYYSNAKGAIGKFGDQSGVIFSYQVKPGREIKE